MVGELLLEARFLEFVANECAGLPLIKAKFDLVVNVRDEFEY